MATKVMPDRWNVAPMTSFIARWGRLSVAPNLQQGRERAKVMGAAARCDQVRTDINGGWLLRRP